MKEETKFGIVICILCALIIALIWLLLIPTANAAEPHAIVSFNGYELYADTVSFDGPTDLIVKTREVIGVCDTTWMLKNDVWFATDSRGNVRYVPYDSMHPDRKIPVITCRELVCVTVTKFPEKMKDVKCIPCPVIPGEAIICWKIKEE